GGEKGEKREGEEGGGGKEEGEKEEGGRGGVQFSKSNLFVAIRSNFYIISQKHIICQILF
ncbi:hypothetical protein, partial [Niallia circulans]|uniref:hypothetical protein n=1 Tax=Niallia circulans TaxID=1397 RepID=UPI003D2CBD70